MNEFPQDRLCHWVECDADGDQHVDVRGGGTLGMLCDEHLTGLMEQMQRDVRRNLASRTFPTSEEATDDDA